MARIGVAFTTRSSKKKSFTRTPEQPVHSKLSSPAAIYTGPIDQNLAATFSRFQIKHNNWVLVSCLIKRRSGLRREIIARLHVLKKSRVGRFPAQQIAGVNAGDW